MTVWIYTFCGRCDHPIKALDHIGTLCTGCGPKTVAGTGSNRNNKRGIRGVRGVESAKKSGPGTAVGAAGEPQGLTNRKGLADGRF